MDKKYTIHISEIEIGEHYIHLPSGEEKIFESETDIDWDVINPDNYRAYTNNLKNRKNMNKIDGKFPKLLIISHMRWGKDTLAEILNEEFGLRFKSSSLAAAEIFIYNELKDKYGYKTPEECFEDRMNHRVEWYEMICDYNKNDKARLAKGILQSADCYVGMRDHNEITECLKQGLFDLVIWVDASKRLPPESSDSFNIDSSCADIIIENNGTLEEYREKIIRLGKILSR